MAIMGEFILLEACVVAVHHGQGSVLGFYRLLLLNSHRRQRAGKFRNTVLAQWDSQRAILETSLYFFAV